jgi:hypothetical protein
MKRIKSNQKKRKNKVKDLYFEYYSAESWSRYKYYDLDSRYRYHRNPATSQECRNSFLTEDEVSVGVKIRGRRSASMLPTMWDDLVTTSWNLKRSWKKNSTRPYQWKYE